MTGQKITKIAYFIVYISQTTLRMPSWDCSFWVWILSSSPAILKKLRIYQRIMTMTIERSGNASQNCWFIKCMQKLDKSICQYFFIWILCHKQQDPGKSCKITLFNTFLMKIWIEKSSHKHQDPAKSWNKQNFNTILNRKNTKILAKAGKNKISILFNENFNRKKQQQTARSWRKLEKKQFFNTFLFESYATNSKILAKAEKLHCSILFWLRF